MILNEELIKTMRDWFNSIDERDQKEYSERVGKITSFNPGDKRFRLFCYLVDLLSKNGLPLVLPDQKFQNIPGKIYYRGVKDINFNASTLADYDYHRGDGTSCLGIYATTDHGDAKKFGRLHYYIFFEEPDKSDVVSFKLKSDSKIVDYNDLRAMQTEIWNYEYDKRSTLTLEELLSKKQTNNNPADEFSVNKEILMCFLKEIHQENPEMYLSIVNSKATIALLLGYDIVKMDECNVAILNRGKMLVSESEFKRITDASKNYKGGVINFDKKADNEFLRE